MEPESTHSSIPNGRERVGIPPTSYGPRNMVVRPPKNAELKSLETRNWLIHDHYCREEYDICKVLIQEELEKSNGMCEYANYLLGLILRHEGKIQESLEYFQTCHTLNPKSVDNIKQVARSLFLLGSHRQAMEAYFEAEKVADKPDWDIYHNIGMCFFHLKDYAKAKPYLVRAIQLGGQECSFENLAKIHYLEGDVDGALEIYIAGTESYPDNADFATNLGLLYMRMGKYQQAFEKLGSALARDPTCTKALLAAGSMMQGHQDFDVALSKYKIASHYNPESAPLWNNIGMCFFEKKKYVAAISCLKRANYLCPFDWKTLYNLGLVHLSTQQYASAFHFLSASINLKPNSACTFMLLALALKYLEDPENTCEAFEQAAKLDPNDASVPLNYAIYLHSQGQSAKALTQLKRFQQLAELHKGFSQEMMDTANRLSISISQVGSSDKPESGNKSNSTNTDLDDQSLENMPSAEDVLPGENAEELNDADFYKSSEMDPDEV
ncbi:Bardet-Biedl syndrome 4 protein [Anabrus simplex]|uniref:Bardet-Biedl syndrome 4 protein n=1 Tax=Anabrus simplex TaxID=316456 RepID=UPI0035A2FA2D